MAIVVLALFMLVAAMPVFRSGDDLASFIQSVPFKYVEGTNERGSYRNLQSSIPGDETLKHFTGHVDAIQNLSLNFSLGVEMECIDGKIKSRKYVLVRLSAPPVGSGFSLAKPSR